jgi:hypothetical protein
VRRLRFIIEVLLHPGAQPMNDQRRASSGLFGLLGIESQAICSIKNVIGTPS